MLLFVLVLLLQAPAWKLLGAVLVLLLALALDIRWH
jgi:hypothetical protein